MFPENQNPESSQNETPVQATVLPETECEVYEKGLKLEPDMEERPTGVPKDAFLERIGVQDDGENKERDYTTITIEGVRGDLRDLQIVFEEEPETTPFDQCFTDENTWETTARPEKEKKLREVKPRCAFKRSANANITFDATIWEELGFDEDTRLVFSKRNGCIYLNTPENVGITLAEGQGISRKGRAESFVHRLNDVGYRSDRYGLEPLTAKEGWKVIELDMSKKRKESLKLSSINE